jgi:hypothetical protein
MNSLWRSGRCVSISVAERSVRLVAKRGATEMCCTTATMMAMMVVPARAWETTGVQRATTKRDASTVVSKVTLPRIVASIEGRGHCSSTLTASRLLGVRRRPQGGSPKWHHLREVESFAWKFSTQAWAPWGDG